jgi:hypothetical protein
MRDRQRPRGRRRILRLCASFRCRTSYGGVSFVHVIHSPCFRMTAPSSSASSRSTSSGSWGGPKRYIATRRAKKVPNISGISNCIWLFHHDGANESGRKIMWSLVFARAFHVFKFKPVPKLLSKNKPHVSNFDEYKAERHNRNYDTEGRTSYVHIIIRRTIVP